MENALIKKEYNTLQFSCQVDSAKANHDRTLCLKIETQELSSDDTARIFSLFQKQIWIALAETPLTEQDLNIPEVIDPLEKKSPSERLRSRMYVYWKESKISDNFDGWYKNSLEKMGDKYLEKLI